MSFPALFDTNVLYGAVLNDYILWLADRGLFRPLWSAEILSELKRNLVKNGEDPERVAKRIDAMIHHFPDAVVSGYESLQEGLLCHPKDRHVLAAAIRANAEVLVTFNVSDFPSSSTSHFDLEVVHPDDFLLDQLALYPGATVGVLRELALIYQRPRLGVSELLQGFGVRLPKFADALRQHLDEIR